MLLAAPLLLLRCFTRHFLFARFQFRPSLWLDMLAAVSQLSGIAVLYFLHWLSAATAMAIMGLSCLIVCGTWSGRLTTPLRVKWPRVFDDWKQNWKFARWALLSQLIGSSTPYVMPWILQVARGEAATGSYAACAALIGLSHMFVCGISNVLTPKATRTYLEEGTKPLCQVLRTTSLVLVAPLSAIVLLLAMFGNDLLVLVFGDKFVGLGPVCVVLSAAAVFNSVAVVAGNGLWAVDRPRLNLWGDGATLLATVVAALLLVQPLGVMGAATATLIGTAAGTIVRGGTLAHCVKRELNLACTN
jgi:O-antigen/teichoic acid export membrane protein